MKVLNERHTKKVMSIVLKNRDTEQYYIEPFVGRCNTISKVDGNRIGNDSDGNLIDMWRSIQQGWIPPKYLHEDDYQYIIDNKDTVSSTTVAYTDMIVTKCLTTSNARRSRSSKIETYSRRGFNEIENIIGSIQGVIFTSTNYQDMQLPKNSIIMCYPPENIADDIFWRWCREKIVDGHQIYIIGDYAPIDFRVIWFSRETNIKLFTYIELNTLI